MSGICSLGVSRLLQTWNKILADQNTAKTFEKLKKIISTENKFRELREAQENVDGPCVPFIGMRFFFFEVFSVFWRIFHAICF